MFGVLSSWPSSAPYFLVSRVGVPSQVIPVFLSIQETEYSCVINSLCPYPGCSQASMTVNMSASGVLRCNSGHLFPDLPHFCRSIKSLSIAVLLAFERMEVSIVQDYTPDPRPFYRMKPETPTFASELPASFSQFLRWVGVCFRCNGPILSGQCVHSPALLRGAAFGWSPSPNLWTLSLWACSHKILNLGDHLIFFDLILFHGNHCHGARFHPSGCCL